MKQIMNEKNQDPCVTVKRFTMHLRGNVLEAYSRTRLLKEQREIFPTLLRARVDSCSEILLRQSQRMAKVNFAAAEALFHALEFRGIKPHESKMMRKIIIGLIESAADRHLPLMPQRCRDIFHDLVGNEIEEWFKKDVQKLIASTVSRVCEGDDAVLRWREDVASAKTVSEVYRASAQGLKRVHPQCVCDFEYFAKFIVPSEVQVKIIEQGISILQDTFIEMIAAYKMSCNVIDLIDVKDSDQNGLFVRCKTPWDVHGVLEGLESHTLFGDIDEVLARLGDKQLDQLYLALTTQSIILQEQVNAIHRHPECAEISNLLDTTSPALQFELVVILEALSEREVFLRKATDQIVSQKSLSAVRKVLADYRKMSNTDCDGDSGFDFDDHDEVDDAHEIGTDTRWNHHPVA